MLESMFKILLKIVKNKKFTKFISIVILLILAFMISNSESSIVQTIVYLTTFTIVRILLLVITSFLLCHNFELGLLFTILVAVVINIPYTLPETFANIPNMVDRSSIVSYNKNFKEPKDITPPEKTKEESVEDKTEDEKSEENVVKKNKKGFAVSEDYYHEKRGKDLENSEKDNVEEINLNQEVEEDTIERELKKKFTNDVRKLEEFDSSSSESSQSESSDSSTDSSDSEKEIEEVSLDKAREHMLKKLRNGIKKKYIYD